MPDEPEERGELLAPYLHPYRRYLPVIWREAHADRTALAGGALAVAGGAAGLMSGEAGWALAAAVVAAIALVIFLRVTVEGALAVWRFTRPWDEPSELETVRARRPHAGEADSEVVHAEFAVTVEEAGFLYVWRFTPLAAFEDPPPGELLVPGRPRHAAIVVEQRPLDPDATRAAEQLVEAQTLATDLEAQAREEARTRAADAGRARELARETSSTAAALQHLTGQRRPDRGD